MVPSIVLQPERRYDVRRYPNRLPSGIGYRLPYAQARYWRHSSFWLAEQCYSGKHAYAVLLEWDARKPVGIPMEATRPDLLWLYQLRGSGSLRPEAPLTGAGLRLDPGYHVPVSTGRGPYLLRSPAGRHRMFYFAVQQSWLRRYREGILSPLRALLAALEHGDHRPGAPQRTQLPHLRLLGHLRRITHASGLQQDAMLYEQIAALIDLYVGGLSSPAALAPAWQDAFGEITTYLKLETSKGNAVSPDEVAADFGLSSRALYRLFEQAGAASPARYIHVLRVEEAYRLLAYEGLTPTAAAYQVGYDHVRTFQRAFKRHYGVTPSSVRGPRHSS